MSLTAQQADFPVGYAQLTKDDANTVFYVEWLDNDNEFPDLNNNTHNNDDDDGTWELLEHKELDREGFTLVDEDNWSKINAFSYVQVAEKNANELKPTKRTVQPLYPNVSNKQTTKDDSEKENEDLATTLYYTHKSQSRLANRYESLRNSIMFDSGSVDDDKAEVVKFCANVNLAKYKYSYSHGTKNHKKDYSEYSVLDTLTKR